MDFKAYWKKVQINEKTRRVFDELPVIISALSYAILIASITYVSDGMAVALRSLLWQLPYTYVASKIVFYSAKYFALHIEKNWLAYVLAIALPSLFSLTGTYIVQEYIVGVSHVFPTLIPTLVTTPFACFGWAKVQRSLRNAPTTHL